MAICRSCGAKIEFQPTKTGSNMPVDPEYIEHDEGETGMKIVTDGGNVITIDEGVSRPSVRGRISHFSTCPDADKFRRK